MEKLKKYGNSIWRVPLIAVIADFLYAPIYTRIVLGFGIIQPGVIDKRVSLFADAGITMAKRHRHHFVNYLNRIFAVFMQTQPDYTVHPLCMTLTAHIMPIS